MLNYASVIIKGYDTVLFVAARNMKNRFCAKPDNTIEYSNCVGRFKTKVSEKRDLIQKTLTFLICPTGEP